METNKHSSIYVIIAAIVIVAGGIYFYMQSPGGKTIVEEKPALTDDQLLGKTSISNEEKSAVEKHKQEILDRVASSRALSDEEKQTISRIMLMEAHVYGFTETEREAIFAKLRQ